MRLRQRIRMREGAELLVEAGQFYEVPPGHDAWVVGDEPWITIDWQPSTAFTRTEGGGFDRHRLQDRAQVLHAPLVDTAVLGRENQPWNDVSVLPDLPPVDLLFVDWPVGSIAHQVRYPAYPLLADRLAPGATVVLDDTGRPTEAAIAKACKQEFFGGRWLRECGASIVRPRLSARTSSRLAVASKLLRHASIAIKADAYGNLIGTIAQKAVAGAGYLIADRSGGGCLIRASSSVARGLRLGEMAVVLAWRNR